MIKNRKGILILVILFSILYFVFSAIYTAPNKNKYEKTVFLGSNTKVNVKDGNIIVYNKDIELEKLEVKVYFDKEFVDGYISSEKSETSTIENTYVIYDKNMDSLLQESDLIAHTKDLTLKIKDINKINITNLDDVYKFTKSNNIDLSGDIEIDYIQVTNFDLDDDNKDEKVYSVGLYGESQYISFVYMERNDKYILIDKVISNNSTANVRLYFSNLIDFNSDDFYEFVINKIMTEYGPNYYELYNFNGSKFIKIGGE